MLPGNVVPPSLPALLDAGRHGRIANSLSDLGPSNGAMTVHRRKNQVDLAVDRLGAVHQEDGPRPLGVESSVPLVSSRANDQSKLTVVGIGSRAASRRMKPVEHAERASRYSA